MLGILYGHMLPKRGQLFMTPIRNVPSLLGGIDCPFINRRLSALDPSLGPVTKGNETIQGMVKGERLSCF